MLSWLQWLSVQLRTAIDRLRFGAPCNTVSCGRLRITAHLRWLLASSQPRQSSRCRHGKPHSPLLVLCSCCRPLSLRPSRCHSVSLLAHNKRQRPTRHALHGSQSPRIATRAALLFPLQQPLLVVVRRLVHRSVSVCQCTQLTTGACWSVPHHAVSLCCVVVEHVCRTEVTVLLFFRRGRHTPSLLCSLTCRTTATLVDRVAHSSRSTYTTVTTQQ